MKINLKKMWVVIFIIWGGSIALTYLNMTTIKKIKIQQQDAEAIIMDGRYVKDNFAKINKVFEKRATLEQSIESVKLGLISIENQIRAIGMQNSLMKIGFSDRHSGSGGNEIPIIMICEGKSEGILRLLETIEKEYPFLPVTAIDLMKTQEGLNFRFQVTMIYRFKIAI